MSETNCKTVGVIGLGNMGFPVSQNLMQAGFSVVGFDPLPEKQDRLRGAGGTVAASAQEVGQRCQAIITLLPSEQALQETIDAFYDSCSAGTIVMECSTMSVDAKKKARDRMAERDIVLLDCPLSGTGAQAIYKDVVVYASGDSVAITACVPIFEGFARLHYDLGEFGKGTYMKFVANHLVAIHNLAAAEAVLLGVHCGLDAHQIVDVIGHGSGTSRMFEVRAPLMADQKWEAVTITNRLFQKDLRLIGDALRDSGTPAPLFFSTLPIYTAAMACGHAEDDTASIYDVLDKMSTEKKEQR